MLELRVADGSLLRLIGKRLHVGVRDGAEPSAPQTGTVRALRSFRAFQQKSEDWL